MTSPMYVPTAVQQMDVHAASATTDATGAVTFTLPAGLFSTIYSVQAQAIRDTVLPTTAAFALVRTATPTSVVVQVFESKTTTASNGATIEGLEKTATATTVHLVVFGN